MKRKLKFTVSGLEKLRWEDYHNLSIHTHSNQASKIFFAHTVNEQICQGIKKKKPMQNHTFPHAIMLSNI